MNNTFQRLALVVVALIVLCGELWGQNRNTNRTPAEASFREDAFTAAPTDRIRGDELGSYRDDGPSDPDCAIAWVDNGGMFFLRTVKPNCTPTLTGRTIVLDFSDPVAPPASCDVRDKYGNPLNMCSATAIADVRIIAHSLFKDSALTSGTTVTLPFSLQADFTSTAFELEFEQPVSVSALSVGLRILEAPATAVAELYQYVQQGRKTTKVSLGRFRMPFQLTVAKQ